MPPEFFIKGLVIGFSIAAPVGPIGVLCIRRSVVDGRLIGFVTGLGAATADAAYGAVAAFGLTAVSSFLMGQKFWLALVGGVFLSYLGIRTFFARPPLKAVETRTSGIMPAFASTVVLTLTNPATILSFVAVFAGFGLAASPDYRSASLLIAGVFLGSAAWWLILSSGVGALRSRVDDRWLRIVNRASGLIILSFGAYALAVAFRHK
jgi:threonine/homoserine/homoserine lactone efflux protein